jgi:probable HAF family extracellular repeat protein
MIRIFRLFAGAALAAASLAAEAAGWQVFDLGAPNDRTTEIRVAAVNDRGEITGGVTMSASGPIPERAAFVFSRGAFELIGGGPTVAKDINKAGVVVGKDFLPFIYDGEKTALAGLTQFSSVFAINDRGHVVGAMQVPGGFHAFDWTEAGIGDLGTLGGTRSEAFGINGRGDVVGWSTLSDEGFPKSFVYPKGGPMRPLGSMGGRYSVAYAINDRGVIAGTAENEHLQRRGFIFRDGGMTDIGALPGMQSCDAIDLNDKAEVVGICGAVVGSEFVVKPFVWREGVMTDLAALSELAAAGFTSWITHGELVGASYGEGPGVAINNHGQIVGAGIKDGKPRLFLLSPKPGRG